MSQTRFARVQLASGHTHYASVDGERVQPLSAAPWHAQASASGPALSLQDVTLLCPVESSKVIGIGRNYKAHAKELGHALPSEPLLFLKPPSSLQGPGVAVQLPPQSERVDFEAELGVVIGKTARHLAVERALDCVFGYTLVCDVTARDLQKKDDQWTRAKGFDTFCPTGPFIVPGLDPNDLQIQLKQNGTLRQDGNSSDMIFTVAELIAYISSVMTLQPGDLIATGTPSGVGPMRPGDHIELSIAGIGQLHFPVVGAG